MKWEGEAPAEPETAASSEWRVANSFFSGGQCSRTAENFGALGDAPSRIFRRIKSALKKIRHQPMAKAGGMDRAVKQLFTSHT
jgi:hypothetical protein